MRIVGTVAAAILVTGMAAAQTATTATTATTMVKHTAKKPVVKKDATAEQLEALKAQMAEQQRQIDALKEQVADKDQALSSATTATATAQQTATDATAQASQATQEKVTALQSTVTDLKTTDQGLQETVIANQARVNEAIDSPSALHYKGITITPVAFFAFEGVWRQHSVNSDINTPFNSIPLPSANEGHVSELNFSGRQTRLGGLFEGNAGNFKLSGYFEADFLGTGTSSNNNQSNSYVLRQRQVWAKAETSSGFAITGGQTWSLVTEDGMSTNVRTEKLPNTIDSQYMVGFSWERQPGIRVQQRFGVDPHHALTVAMSLEQAQITGFNVASTVAAAIPTQFFFGGPGQNGGLYNAAGNIGNGNTTSSGGITTYANNIAPDLIVKAAVDLPKAHFELGGLARFLRDVYLPITGTGGNAAAPTYSYGTNYIHDIAAAGGVFGSGRVSPSKYVDVAVQAMLGEGVGRYGSSQLADATLRPDQGLEPIRNYHGMFSLETHPTPKLDVFGYYGGEYAQRTVYQTAQGDLIGYGPQNLNDAGCYALPAGPGSSNGSTGSISPVTCASPTRYIQEVMLGFTYRAISSPKYGRLQYSATYSRIQRNLWSGATAGAAFATPTGPRAEDPMIHVGMRYYIP